MDPALTIALICFCRNLALLLTASLTGFAILSSLRPQLPDANSSITLELFLYATGIGFTFDIALLFLLGLGKLLNPHMLDMALVAIPALSTLICLLQRTQLQQWLCRTSVTQTTLYRYSLIGAVLLALYSLLLCVQVTGLSDGTSYHLPYARFYLMQGGLAVNENLRYPYHSHNGNLLYVLGLTYGDSIYCQTLHSLFGILTSLVIFALCTALGIAAPLALLGSGSFLTLDIFLNLTNKADVDLFLGFFINLCLLALLRWYRKPDNRMSLVLSAIFFGMAMGTKYLGTLHALPIAIAILFRTRSLRSVCLYAGVATLSGSWWYLRSWILSGNPVHPFLPEIFGLHLWDAMDIQLQMQALSGFMEKNLVTFLTLPVYFGQASLAYTGLTPWMFLLYAATFLCFLLHAGSRILLLVIWLSLAFWFCTSQIWRYLLPIAPLILVVGLDLAHQLISRGYRLARNVLQQLPEPAALTPILLGLILAYLLKSTSLFVQAAQELPNRPLTSTRQDLMLAKWSDAYRLVQTANRYFLPSQKVLLLEDYNVRYFLAADSVGETFGPNRSRDFRTLIATAGTDAQGQQALEAFRKKLLHLEVEGFIIPRSIPFHQELFDQHFEPLHRNPAGFLYRLKTEY